MGASVGESRDVFVGVAVGAAVDAAVGDHGLPRYVGGAAVEIAVEITMASAMGLHDVPLLAAAFNGSPWSVRGNPWRVRDYPWSVRGCPWSDVDMAVEFRGGPWAPSRYSSKNIYIYIFIPRNTVGYRRGRSCGVLRCAFI